MDKLTAYKSHLQEMSVIASTISLLGWDQHTHMPPRGIAARSQVSGRLSKHLFELTISPEFGEMIEALKAETSLTTEEKASVRDMAQLHQRRKAIPAELAEEVAIARSKAQAAWAEAREKSDFSIFEPLLGKMVDYAKRFADYFGYDQHPYDGLLDDYEPGMTVKKLTGIIQPLREQLVPFMKRLASDGTRPDTSPIEGSFDVDTQRELARRALEIVGYDFDAGTLDDVAHPFSMAIAHGDVRITNRYLEDHVTSGLFYALHEGGHALYSQGMTESVYQLMLYRGASSGIHESQSRMIENQIGRGLPFWKHFQPVLAEFFSQFADVSPEALYKAVNVVEPSLIRADADEITYNLHIMLRAELEADLIAGDIQVADLPKRWNEAMENYLGVTPPNDALGVLQDAQWSMGYFGYFPSYMLGNLYASQMVAKIRQDLPDLDDHIAAGDIMVLINWLRENVHQLGGVYKPDDLMNRITGASLDSSHFVRYVVDKYSDIYQLP